jgi:hypothetical protein
MADRAFWSFQGLAAESGESGEYPGFLVAHQTRETHQTQLTRVRLVLLLVTKGTPLGPSKPWRISTVSAESGPATTLLYHPLVGPST